MEIIIFCYKLRTQKCICNLNTFFCLNIYVLTILTILVDCWLYLGLDPHPPQGRENDVQIADQVGPTLFGPKAHGLGPSTMH